LGNFDCFAYICGSDVPQAILQAVLTNPGIVLRRKELATNLIRRYQTRVSVRTPARCRFDPTCSNYGLQAIDRYGVGLGIWLICQRLARCRSDVAWGTPDPIPLSRG
jgi:putative membrane protein insertion efficiency factor